MVFSGNNLEMTQLQSYTRQIEMQAYCEERGSGEGEGGAGQHSTDAYQISGWDGGGVPACVLHIPHWAMPGGAGAASGLNSYSVSSVSCPQAAPGGPLPPYDIPQRRLLLSNPPLGTTPSSCRLEREP